MNSKKFLAGALGLMLLSSPAMQAEGFGRQVAGIALTAYGVGSIISSFHYTVKPSTVVPNKNIVKIHSPCFFSSRLWWGALFTVLGVGLVQHGYQVACRSVVPQGV